MSRNLIFATTLFAFVFVAISARRQDASAPAAALSQADLEEMLAPIALYSDALLANVLAASVYPDELTAAQNFVKGGGKPDAIDAQSWEPPVKAIAKVPAALTMLADNIDWTTAIGQAYIVQSQDVMAAVQSLRGKAQVSGALKSNQQQTVVESGQSIIIESPSPEVVYVPTYPPAVYAPPPPDSGDNFWGNVVSFGAGVATGAILANNIDCDWDGGCVGWGHGDVDIDREVNIGEVNIDNSNVNNVQNRVNSGNKVGNEGTAWKPNNTKVDTNKVKAQAQSGSLQNYKGASQGTAKNMPKTPGRTAGDAPVASRTGANQAGAANRSGASASPAGANRGGAAASPAGANRPAAKPAAPKAPGADRSASPSAAKPRTPEAPKARSAPQSSGFNMDRNSAAQSSRGNASRGGGGGGGASRGGGGGGGGRR